jgi:type II secretory pathway predicted ATPase ExeA
MSFLYLEHFGLNKPPFQITPDIDFFFSGSRRGDILTALIHVACHEEGIVTAVAEVGSGKTLLARLMISRLPPDIFAVYLANPCFSRDEIISAIARDLGLANLPASIEEKLSCLHQELLRRHAEGERVLLVIDEAHAMPVESLEEVRLLSNLETGQNKLVNIMLFGQPELDTLLAEHRLRQVRDRVIHRFELPPLPRDEGATYIDHRLRIAGWSGGKLFTDAAIALLHKASGGRARRINLLADKAMLSAYAEGLKRIDKRHVKSACEELHADPATTDQGGFPWLRVCFASLLLSVVMTGAALGIVGWHRPDAAPIALQALAPTPPPASATVPSPTAGMVQPGTPSVAPAAPHLPTPVAATPTRSDSTPVSVAAQRTASLLKDQNLHGYTLQLATLPPGADLTNYMNSIDRRIDFSSIYLHNQNNGGKLHSVVYFGRYAKRDEARTALNDLPETLKANQPQIRTWDKIRQETQP